MTVQNACLFFFIQLHKKNPQPEYLYKTFSPLNFAQKSGRFNKALHRRWTSSHRTKMTMNRL